MTNQLFLVVKGDANAAELEGQKRGIELTVEATSRNGQETYCHAPTSEKRKVIDWFCEEANFYWGGSKLLPSGALLLYGERSE